MKTEFWRALRILVVLTLLTGVVYPLAITAVAKAFFPDQASGSLIIKEGKVIGSRLIAQKFTNPKYFWPRPSAIDFNPLPSGGSNLGPTSKKLIAQTADLTKKLLSTAERGHPGFDSIPQELIFTSGSGLDPHLSRAGVEYQVGRVAAARAFNNAQREALSQLVKTSVVKRQFGFLGEETINVIELNLAVDRL